MAFKQTKGDIVQLAIDDYIKVVLNTCNCACLNKGVNGSELFDVNKFPKEHFTERHNINKLATLDYKAIRRDRLPHGESAGIFNRRLSVEANVLYVVNAYTHFSPTDTIDFGAFRLCLRKVNFIFDKLEIGINRIDKDWDKLFEIIKEELTDCKINIIN